MRTGGDLVAELESAEMDAMVPLGLAVTITEGFDGDETMAEMGANVWCFWRRKPFESNTLSGIGCAGSPCANYSVAAERDLHLAQPCGGPDAVVV